MLILHPCFLPLNAYIIALNVAAIGNLGKNWAAEGDICWAEDQGGVLDGNGELLWSSRHWCRSCVCCCMPGKGNLSDYCTILNCFLASLWLLAEEDNQSNGSLMSPATVLLSDRQHLTYIWWLSGGLEGTKSELCCVWQLCKVVCMQCQQFWDFTCLNFVFRLDILCVYL